MKAADAMVEQWDALWGSFHEAAHAVVARRLGMRVEKVTMTYTRVPHPLYKSLDDERNLDRLVVSCAGDAATLVLCGGWTQIERPGGDDGNSLDRLEYLGATKSQADEMLKAARDVSAIHCDELRNEIWNVADELRANGELNEAQLDEAISEAGYVNWKKHAAHVQMFREYFEKHPKF